MIAVAVIVVIILIIITVVVGGIIVVWKRKKSEQHTKPEGVYYSTINKLALQKSLSNKPEPVYAEMDELYNKEPQYMVISEITDRTKQT